MGKNLKNKTIVVSAINFFEGGPLSVLNDCVKELQHKEYYKYDIKILVHNVDLIKFVPANNIEVIAFPKSRTSYFYRLYYEYFYFYKLSKTWDVYLWFSLHDISPFVVADKQAVYCHNPSIFSKSSLRDFYLQSKFFFFTIFYKWLYKINIRANKYVIVQSLWMKNAFSKMYSLPSEKIIVSKPNITSNDFSFYMESLTQTSVKSFFYPAFPRSFKNFEIIGEACNLLYKKGITDYQVYLTIDGSENAYSKIIVEKYKHIPNIKFIGLLKREKVFEFYKKANILLFVSTLETWGLPISEFKQYNKPIILIDLPYAHETLGEYDKVNFFKHKDILSLSILMEKHIKETIVNEINQKTIIPPPSADNWSQLFEILLL